MSKRSSFRGPIDKENWKRPEALLKPASQHLYEIYWSLPNQLSWKKSLLLTCKTLRLLVNKLPSEEKYIVPNKDTFRTPIQMQLSQKQKNFSQIFSGFLKFTLNFEYFQKKDNPQGFCISGITDSEHVVR